MRQIKFIAKAIEGEFTDKWVYGFYLESNGNSYIKTEVDLIMVDPKTVCQFTGLHDKNEEEIYEEDVIRNHNQGFLHESNQRFVIEWNEGKEERGVSGELWLSEKPGFKFKKLHKGITTIFCQETLEVIGNKFDNPELLNNDLYGNR